MTDLSCDFLVIGAGMAGMSAAAALTPYGRVIVVEREQHPGYHATGRSAAIFADSYGNEVVRRLSADSRPMLEQWDGATILRPRGLMYLTLRSSQGEAFDELTGLPFLSAADACALVPILRADSILGARYEAGAADIDVDAMMSGYVRILRATDGLLLRSAEVRAATLSSGDWRIDLGDDSVTTPIVINAAGGWAGEVGALFGAANPGLVAKRRNAAIIDGPPDCPVDRWPMVVDIDKSFYFKPEGGKLMLSPADADPTAPCDAFADDFAIAVAVDRLETVTTLRVRHVRSPWAGLRTFAPDETPVIGFDPQAEGLFWLAGQGGFGIQTAPAAASLAAALITQRAVAADMAAAVWPARFGDGSV